MEIHTHSFCGISQSEDWQTFLAEIAPKLHSDLMSTLNQRKGCRTNSLKMQEIYVKLYEQGNGPAFETFITRRFPWLIKSNEPAKPQQILEKTKASFDSPSVVKQKQVSDLNKHKIFRVYRPDILTFPQKMIIAGDPSTLHQQVQLFCNDKLAVDYVIIDDRAYIEYFHPKFRNVIDKIKREKREIYQYRQKMKQND